MGKKGYTVLLLVFLYTLSCRAEEEFLFFDANYKGDIVSNTVGGIDRGITYLGCATMGVGFRTDKAGWWTGGTLYLKGANTHGGEPSSSLVGDLHIVDNIEAGDHTFLQELWVRQSFSDRFDFAVGLQDLNADFAVSSETGHFIHSSLGINTVMVGSVPTPVFPLMGLGLQVGCNLSSRWRWQACVFDGEVTGFDENPYNVEWKVNRKEGFLFCSEVHYGEADAFAYKLGGYYHSEADRYGFYLIGEHRVQSVGLFSQVAWAPKDRNETYAQMDAGVNLHDAFTCGKGDVLGLAVTCNLLDNDRKHETVLEMTYRYPLWSHLWLQPDLQYVINPAGGVTSTDNALVAILRVELEF